MKIDKSTMLFVVSQDGMSQMDLESLASAIQGGSKLASLMVFTTRAEAEDELQRRQLMYKSIEALKQLDLVELETVVGSLVKTAHDLSVERALKVVEKALG